MNQEKIDEIQEQICRKYGAAFSEPELDKMVGVAVNLGSSTRPINGLHHSTTETTTGWFIWAGDHSYKKDFFKPMHLKHLIQLHPEVVPYLGLPPGWRFLIDPDVNHEDAWRDDKLLLDE